jgi:hypothetical protein
MWGTLYNIFSRRRNLIQAHRSRFCYRIAVAANVLKRGIQPDFCGGDPRAAWPLSQIPSFLREVDSACSMRS